MGLGGWRHAQAALPPEGDLLLFAEGAGWRQGRSDRAWKVSPLPELDPRTL